MTISTREILSAFGAAAMIFAILSVAVEKPVNDPSIVSYARVN